MRKLAKKGTKTKPIQKGPEFWQKKLHAAKVNLKRAVKKAKDLHVRKLVKKLKAKQSDDLDAELRRAKEVDVDGLCAKVLEGALDGADKVNDQESSGNAKLVNRRGDATMDDVERSLSRSEGVVQQMAVVDEMREKLDEARRGGDETRADAGDAGARSDVDARKNGYGEGKDEIVDTEEAKGAGSGSDSDVDVDGDGERVAKLKKRKTPKANEKGDTPADLERMKPIASKQDVKRKERKQEKKKPKNRLGQRARQRLAEKQYGKDKALHIIENRARDQKRREQQARSKERDADVGDYRGKKANGDVDHPRKRKDRIVKAGAEDDPATLHPSWQAKKALTQKIVIPDITASASKNKIVFD